jgi:type VI protein secretion system component VasK
MRANHLRLLMVATFAAAAVLSVVGNKDGSPFVRWLSFALFITGVFLFASWRRASVLDREAKTSDETRTSPDQ